MVIGFYMKVWAQNNFFYLYKTEARLVCLIHNFVVTQWLINYFWCIEVHILIFCLCIMKDLVCQNKWKLVDKRVNKNSFYF